MSLLVKVMLIVAPVLWVCMPLAVFSLPRSRFRIGLIAAFGTSGSVAAAIAGISMLTGSHEVITASIGSWQGLGTAGVRVDALSGFFLALTGVVSALLFVGRTGTLSQSRGRLPVAGLATLMIALEVVFIANNAFLFLLGWEGLAIAFYLLVVAGFQGPREATSAAFWTMSMMKVSGAAVLGAFILLASDARSLDFSIMQRLALHAGQPLIDGVFLLALVGFGIKVALLPVQSWLPRGYPAAPVGIPAFLAAVGLNAGFYGFIRVMSFLPAGPVWWGSIVVLIGSITALGGIVYAAVQTDLKALIAYSSIENAGIIMTAIGTAMIGRATHLALLTGLGLVTALLQITIHAVSKAGLFLCADAVERHTTTTDMERLGGLVSSLPWITVMFIGCAATLTGLPPTGGFPSEWLALETLMQGFRIGALLPQVVMALAGALLALTAAVAGIAFVKALFATFLGIPREHRPDIRVRHTVVIGSAGLALLGVAIGIGIPWVIPSLARAAAAAGSANVDRSVSAGNYLIEPAFAHFASIAPTQVALVLCCYVGLVIIVGWTVRNRSIKTVRTPVWNSGLVPFDSRTQYTPTGWSNPTRVVFDTFLRTVRTRQARGPRLGPVGVRYSSHVPLLIDQYFVIPVVHTAERIGSVLQRLQSGHLSRYLFYLLAVIVVILLVVPAVVR